MASPPSRRTVLRSLGAGALAVLAGCSNGAAADELAHTVSVYLADRDATRSVTVTVTAADGSVVFDREYVLSDANEADEDATFPASTDPRTVVVTVDGSEFERAWPGLDDPAEECGDANRRGVEVWVEGLAGEPAQVRLEGNCQHVTLE